MNAFMEFILVLCIVVLSFTDDGMKERITHLEQKVTLLESPIGTCDVK